MSIIATEKSSVKRDYPTPPAGMQDAVCVEVRDLGIQKQTWQGVTKDVHKIMFAWEIDSTYEYTDDEGTTKERRHMLFDRYTLSLASMGNLKPFLESWLGRDLEGHELNGFDLSSMVGKPCQILVSHREYQGKTYANVKSIVPASEANGLLPSGQYKGQQEEGSVSTDDDDLPI